MSVLDPELLDWQTALEAKVVRNREAIVGQGGRLKYEMMLARARELDNQASAAYRQFQDAVLNAEENLTDPSSPKEYLSTLSKAQQQILRGIPSGDVRNHVQQRLDEEFAYAVETGKAWTDMARQFGAAYGDPKRLGQEARNREVPGLVGEVAKGFSSFPEFLREMTGLTKGSGAEAIPDAARQTILAQALGALNTDTLAKADVMAEGGFTDQAAGDYLLQKATEGASESDRATIEGNLEGYRRLAAARMSYLNLAAHADDYARQMVKDGQARTWNEAREAITGLLRDAHQPLQVLHDTLPKLKDDEFFMPPAPTEGPGGNALVAQTALRAMERFTRGIRGKVVPPEKEAEIRGAVGLLAPSFQDSGVRKAVILPGNLQTALDDVASLIISSPHYALSGGTAAFFAGKAGLGKIAQVAAAGAGGGAGGVLTTPEGLGAKERLLGAGAAAVLGGGIGAAAGKIGEGMAARQAAQQVERQAGRTSRLAQGVTPRAVGGAAATDARPTIQLGWQAAPSPVAEAAPTPAALPPTKPLPKAKGGAKVTPAVPPAATDKKWMFTISRPEGPKGPIKVVGRRGETVVEGTFKTAGEAEKFKAEVKAGRAVQAPEEIVPPAPKPKRLPKAAAKEEAKAAPAAEPAATKTRGVPADIPETDVLPGAKAKPKAEPGVVGYAERSVAHPETGAPTTVRTEWRVRQISGSDYEKFGKHAIARGDIALERRTIKYGKAGDWEPMDLYPTRAKALADIEMSATPITKDFAKIREKDLARMEQERVAKEAAKEKAYRDEIKADTRRRSGEAFRALREKSKAPESKVLTDKWIAFVEKHQNDKEKLRGFLADAEFMKRYNAVMESTSMLPKRKALKDFFAYVESGKTTGAKAAARPFVASEPSVPAKAPAEPVATTSAPPPTPTKRNQLSAELDEGRAAALHGLPFTANPYRPLIGRKDAPYRVDEIARNWESGWSSVPPKRHGALAPDKAPPPTPPTGEKPIRSIGSAAASELLAVAPVEGMGTPVDRAIAAIKEIKPLQRAQAALYSKERGERVARMAKVPFTGEASVEARKAALRGRHTRVSYESIRNRLTQEDLDALLGDIEAAPFLRPLEKHRAQIALKDKLFGTGGAELPQPNETELLGQVFGQGFVDAISRHLPQPGIFTKLIGASRAIRSIDVASAQLRQGLPLLARNPRLWLKTSRQGFRSFGTEKMYQEMGAEVLSHPEYRKLRKAGLSLPSIAKGDRLAQEERYMGAEFVEGLRNLKSPNLAVNVAEAPLRVLGQSTRMSDRGYQGFLTYGRMVWAGDIVQAARKAGIKMTEEEYRKVARFVNDFTGRGILTKKVLRKGQIVEEERRFNEISSLLFSPRFYISAARILDPRHLISYAPGAKTLAKVPMLRPLVTSPYGEFVRKEALRTQVQLAVMASTVLGLAKLAGFEAGMNPWSADFGKVRVGKTRYDILRGLPQYPRLLAQLLFNKTVSSTTGKETTLGEGFRARTRYDVARQFIEGKEAPALAALTDVLKGTTFEGKPVTPISVLRSLYTPMFTEDIADVLASEPGQFVSSFVGSQLGVGVNTYPTETTHAMDAASRLVVEREAHGEKPTAEMRAYAKAKSAFYKTIRENAPKEEYEAARDAADKAARAVLGKEGWE